MKKLLMCLAIIPCIGYSQNISVENPDKFPSNDVFVFSRLQTPWTRDSSVYNTNHDSIAMRIYNKGTKSLSIKSISASDTTNWKLRKIGSKAFSSALFPFSISPGTYVSLTTKFVASNVGTRVKILKDTIRIVSSDSLMPIKQVYFRGLWQRQGESTSEPYAQEIITAFGFKTNTGFYNINTSRTPKGDEIIPNYFVRADTSLPVYVRQMSAYHGCCTVGGEKIMWYKKGSDTVTTIFTHLSKDGQRVLPRKSTGKAEGSFKPMGSFGLKVGSKDFTDSMKNPGHKIGIRVWKARNEKGTIIPNTYIISNDYLGSTYTNYDYNDNMYYVTNVKPAPVVAAKAAPASVISSVSVYPNPVKDRMRLKNLQGNSVLQLIDVTGRMYQLGKVEGSNTEVDISRWSLKPGFYYLKIISENGPAEIIKLIIQ